jgi:hypothetical protein
MRIFALAVLAVVIPGGLIAQTTAHVGTPSEIAAREKLNDQ